jgi:hypothetical protein
LYKREELSPSEAEIMNVLLTSESPLPRKVTVPNTVLFQEMAGECVLLDLAGERYFGLDDVGSRIWHLLVAESDPSKVLSKLTQEYETDAATLRGDLAALIGQLHAQGLISVEA